MLKERKQILRPLVDWPDSVTLTPYSGVQILDFGFRLEEVAFRSCRFIERVSEEAPDGAGVSRMLIPLSGDEERDTPIEAAARNDDDPYSIRAVAALEPFLSHWVPMPVLRLKAERGASGEERYDPGPSSWARLRTVELSEPDPETGHTHRVQLAIDTTLTGQDQSLNYVAPERADAEKPRDFRLVSDPAHMDWFLRRPQQQDDGRVVDPQLWVSDWLKDLFLRFKRNERPGRTINEDTLPHLFEHWARYLAYLKFLDAAIAPPRLHFSDTVSERDRVTPVDVDLVLDVGNSRTCGILIENFPGKPQVELTRAFPLEIRDLSKPELSYSGLFESRVEFAELRFGEEIFASRSGRRKSFIWPGFVRVGPEAIRLVEGETGTETISGLSSPKRYLWDDNAVQQDWRFHGHLDPNNLPKSIRSAMRHLNETGDVLEQVDHEVSKRLRKAGSASTNQAIRPRFSRSSLFSFMLAEIFSHALVQVNDPASRSRRQQSDLPRRLNRIILTLPTATSAQEQAIIRSRAEGALRLVWAMQGVKETDSSISRRPGLVVEWDEASCTQLVYLFSELTQKFDGRIDAFLTLKGRPRIRPGETSAAPSLRLACIDIGGGTTDLMITTYWCQANRLLLPNQTFREGFRIAGDDLVQRIVSGIILPQVQRSVEAAGGRFVGEKLRELFGGDIGGQDQQAVHKRRQFGLRVFVPLAVAILEHCELAEEFDQFDLRASDVLGIAGGDAPVAGEDTDDPGDAAILATPPELLDYIERAAESVGASGWRLGDLVISTSREDVDAIAREVFQKVLGNMSEMIHHLGADVVLLTGRPSRLPAVRSIIEELMVVPPHRLVSMHQYRTGRWYPFRDSITQKVGDPKSTVSVGSMLIALSKDSITNFKVDTSAYRMSSTIRFVGEMDSNEQILDERLLFSDVDLEDTSGGGGQTATVDMYAPMHIGTRQLPLERWTTTPLFRLDFGDSSALRRKPPIRVTLEKAEFDDDDETDNSEELLRREALREAFEVESVEDGEGDEMKTTDISLRLQTLGFEDEYWIDTGIFRI